VCDAFDRTPTAKVRLMRTHPLSLTHSLTHPHTHQRTHPLIFSLAHSRALADEEVAAPATSMLQLPSLPVVAPFFPPPEFQITVKRPKLPGNFGKKTKKQAPHRRLPCYPHFTFLGDFAHGSPMPSSWVPNSGAKLP